MWRRAGAFCCSEGREGKRSAGRCRDVEVGHPTQCSTGTLSELLVPVHLPGLNAPPSLPPGGLQEGLHEWGGPDSDICKTDVCTPKSAEATTRFLISISDSAGNPVIGQNRAVVGGRASLPRFRASGILGLLSYEV